MKVLDTGQGFSKDMKEIAFQEMFSTKTAGRGRGLLEIQEAVGRLGGSIQLYEERPASLQADAPKLRVQAAKILGILGEKEPALEPCASKSDLGTSVAARGRDRPQEDRKLFAKEVLDAWMEVMIDDEQVAFCSQRHMVSASVERVDKNSGHYERYPAFLSTPLTN